jgi:hypothetical protein
MNTDFRKLLIVVGWNKLCAVPAVRRQHGGRTASTTALLEKRAARSSLAD